VHGRGFLRISVERCESKLKTWKLNNSSWGEIPTAFLSQIISGYCHCSLSGSENHLQLLIDTANLTYFFKFLSEILHCRYNLKVHFCLRNENTSTLELVEKKQIAVASCTFACDSDPSQSAADLCATDLLVSLFSLFCKQSFFPRHAPKEKISK